MYVNTNGVVDNQIKLRPSSSPNHRPKRQGHAFAPQTRLSHLRETVKTANKFAVIAVLVFAVLTTAFAAAKLSSADAHIQGAINTFGDAQYLGNPAINAGETAVAIDSVSRGGGYWTVTNTGRVSGFGAAGTYGDLAGRNIKNIVNIVATSSNRGYWLLGSDGGVFTFGDANFYGSAIDLGATKNPYVAIVPSRSQAGYNLVDNTGAVYSFGDAQYYGGANGITSGDKIVDVASTQTGEGYTMVASKGGVFTFGDAHFFGALSASQLNKNAVSIALANNDTGYWILGDDGGVFTFGSLDFMGSSVETPRGTVPSTDIAVSNEGKGYWVLNGASRMGSISKTATTYGPEVWAALRNCESHGNYEINTGNGFYGAYQFSAPTWRSMKTGYEFAHQAPPEVQDDAAIRLQQRGGWGQWPVCSKVALRQAR